MAGTHQRVQPAPLALVPTLGGAVVGGLIGGWAGLRIGAAMLDEPTRTAEHPLDDLVLNTFEVIGDLLLVGAVTIVVVCLGVALGVYGALRLARERHAAPTALLCIALDFGAVPGAFVVAIGVDEIAPSLSVPAGLAVIVLAVPIAARWVATRLGRRPAPHPS